MSGQSLRHGHSQPDIDIDNPLQLKTSAEEAFTTATKPTLTRNNDQYLGFEKIFQVRIIQQKFYMTIL